MWGRVTGWALAGLILGFNARSAFAAYIAKQSEHPRQRELLRGEDDSDEGVQDVEGAAHKIVVKPTAFRKWVVANIRADEGTPAMTEANRLVIGDIVRKFLKNHRVRPSHIAMHAPIIVAMLFIKSDADLEAQSLLSSKEARRRHKEHSQTLWWQRLAGITALPFRK